MSLRDLSFSADTAAFHVYRGQSPTQLLRIASDVAVTDEFPDSGLTPELAGPPDENYDHARFYWRLERVPLHPVTLATATTVENSTLEMIDNEHFGMLVRIMRGPGAGQERPVLSNTTTTLTVGPAWDVEPTTSSEFVVVESGWRDGAAGEASPIQFEVPNREGATVQISGRGVNAQGRESAYELSPVTRWVIGGGAGLALDVDVPGPPVFGLEPSGQGAVDLVGISFLELTNTRSIQAATLTAHFWNELASPTQSALATAIDTAATSVTLESAGAGYVGAVIQLGAEVMVVDEVLNGGLEYAVTRASFDTLPEAHAAQTPIYHLDRKVFVVPFVKDFFGSPASGSFSYPMFLPDARIGAAELYVTNIRGNSETTRNNFTGTVDYGLRTLSGGQLSIQVEGYLAIETNA
ncbi:MAG: hypothetical protein GY953_43110, partial [bacterium]|nr:hypothetical protein [bacterium]